MENIHVISTDKPSRLQLNVNTKKLILFNNIQLNNESAHLTTQNIYITNDEEIKEGDWFFRDGSIHKCFRVHKTDIEFLTSIDSIYCGSNTFWNKEFCKKIILTTDQDLIKDGVQAIDDEFLEWFVKNPSCEYVEVKCYSKFNDGDFSDYKIFEEKLKHINKIIIPKQEILPEQIWNEEKMEGIKKLIQKQKLIEIIKSDEELGLYEETLEEVAERLNPYVLNGRTPFKEGFRECAKWQQERILKELQIRVLLIKSEPNGVVRETMINNLLIDF
jgi:hypothetical protein